MLSTSRRDPLSNFSLTGRHKVDYWCRRQVDGASNQKSVTGKKYLITCAVDKSTALVIKKSVTGRHKLITGAVDKSTATVIKNV